jgi:hypothetical protein
LKGRRRSHSLPLACITPKNTICKDSGHISNHYPRRPTRVIGEVGGWDGHGTQAAQLQTEGWNHCHRRLQGPQGWDRKAVPFTGSQAPRTCLVCHRPSLMCVD